MKNKMLRSAAFTVVCLILGILIALQMKSVNAAQISERNVTDLQQRIIEQIEKNRELSDRNALLQRSIDAIGQKSADIDNQSALILQEKERIAVFAGLREARNSGYLIKLQSTNGVRDDVVQWVVNELKALGAQAISINDQRLVTTSEIRTAGDNLVINKTPIDSHVVFEIRTIIQIDDYKTGYLDRMRMQFDTTDALKNQHYVFSFTSEPELVIPALREDSLAFRIDLLQPRADEPR